MNRNPVLPLIDAHALGVIAVVVRDDQGIDVANVFPALGEAAFGLNARDARVK